MDARRRLPRFRNGAIVEEGGVQHEGQHIELPSQPLQAGSQGQSAQPALEYFKN
jgi:hypothetical protein